MHSHLLLFSRSVLSNSLRPNGLQHNRLPYPSLSPRVCANSCPLSQWCHPTISFSETSFPSCFSLSQHHGLFQWVGSSHQVVKVLELQVQHQSFQWIVRVDFLYDWLVWSPWFLISKGLSRIFSSTTIQKHQLFGAQPSLWSNSQHPYMTTGKTIALTVEPLSGKWCFCFLIHCFSLS